jgi:hypothetical protein
VVVREEARFIVIDGYKRVRALKRLARDTVRASDWQMLEIEALLLERGLRCGSEDALDQAWQGVSPNSSDWWSSIVGEAPAVRIEKPREGTLDVA